MHHTMVSMIRNILEIYRNNVLKDSLSMINLLLLCIEVVGNGGLLRHVCIYLFYY